jgi:hypothetical protein
MGRRSLVSGVISIAVLTFPVLVTPAVRAQSEGGFTAPTPSFLAELRRQQENNAWLRLTVDSTRRELRALTIDDAGLSGLTFRRPTSPTPDRIDWPSISRIDVGGSRLINAGAGALVGAVILGLAGGALGATNGE